jgi:hypothetical protein
VLVELGLVEQRYRAVLEVLKRNGQELWIGFSRDYAAT